MNSLARSGVVVIGAGLAGAKTVEALRAEGFDGRIVLVGEETHLPYERPPLSKGYLMGTTERDSVFVHPEQWYADQNVELRLRERVTSIALAEHRVELHSGGWLGYDQLVLATGASPRRLTIPGADSAGVVSLRTIDDSEALAKVLAGGERLVIIGAGWIGLEVSAAARAADQQVTVVETLDLPLLRVLGPEVASVFAQLHREHGVDLRFGASISEITAQHGIATGVRLGDGTVIDAGAVLAAVGVAPNTQLAEACGLTVDNGVLVDEHLRTSDPDVFAVGDVARAFHPLLGRHIRVEHWANALKQPAVAATSILGRPASYAELPYFYTDQYDLGMEYVGYCEPGGFDQVVFRGDPTKGAFIAFWMSGGHVLAGMNVNVWDVTDQIKTLIRERGSVDPDRLADPSIPLTAV